MKRLILICSLALAFGLAQTSQAQFLDKIKKKAEEKVKKEGEKRVEDKINKGVEKAYDEVEKQISGDDKKKEGDAKAKDSKQNTQKNEQVQGNTAGVNTGEAGSSPQAVINSKYDFVPGEKVIYFDDFSQDAVGDFPALWNTNGTAEVVTTNLAPGHWMKFIIRETIWTDELLKLPDNYTIEYDVIPIQGKDKRMAGWHMRLFQAKNPKAWDAGTAPGNGGFEYTVEYYGASRFSTWFNKNECRAASLKGSVDDKTLIQTENRKYHIAIWVQKSRIRLYQDQNKLFDLPKAIPTDCLKIDRLRFEDGAAMISNVRIAVGAPDMRNKLMTEGKLVTYGIYFDVNKDVVKPESYGTLKEIAAILKDAQGVKVKIVGHTDSDGDDRSNLDLSKRRAASVKNALVNDFGISASLLETDGKGESEPVAPNDNATNKALNRRVEFLKL